MLLNFLNSAKSGIRNTAFAITETASPELRAAFREQQRSAVEHLG
ncbi:spore coat protein [Peribacillus sp. ACCC06369]